MTRTPNFTFSVFVFLFFTTSLTAQKGSSILDFDSKTQADFPQHAQLFQDLLSEPIYDALFISKFKDLESIISNDDDFIISIDNRTYHWQPSIVNHSATGFGYSGKFTNANGSLTLGISTNGYSGMIKTENNSYSIMPLDSEYSVLSRRNENLSPLECGTAEGTGSANPCQVLNDCQGIVRVLVLSNNESQDWMNTYSTISFEKYIANKQLQLNGVLFNSELQNKRFELVFHPTPINNVLQEPVQTSQISILPSHPTITDLRKQYEADAVYFFTLHMTSSNGTPDGVAAGINVDQPNAYAMAEIDWDNWGNGITFAHELGHLFGCDHQTASMCAKSYNLTPNIPPNTQGQFRQLTSVWTGSGVNEWIEYYSNPNVTFMGTPAGREESGINTTNAFCAAQVSDRWCDFADFKQTPDFEINISQTFNPDPFDPMCPASFSLQSNITEPALGNPGQPGYTYEWRWSTKPFFSTNNPGTIFSTNPTATLPAPLPTAKGFIRYVQLLVTGSDQFALSQTVRLDFCVPKSLNDKPSSQQYTPVHSKAVMFDITPNPQTLGGGQNVNVTTNLEKGSVRLYDSNGKMLLEQAINDTLVELRVKKLNLSPGVYFISLINSQNDIIETKKLVLQ